MMKLFEPRCAALFGLAAALALSPVHACTSLSYTDANGHVYFGRTLELAAELPYEIAYVPPGQEFTSDAGDGHPPVEYTSEHAILAITMPDRMPTADAPIGPDDLKVLEGMNDAGLTFSVLAYPSAGGHQQQLDNTVAILSAIDLGTWTLGQFSTVAEVKAALADQPALLEPLSMLGGAQPPLHFVLHDRSGASIVIEYDDGEQHVYDNPVGVMTNGPAFPWHLTNLANYTFLTNLDTSSATFGGLRVTQPDSGIATAGLPSSNTSVGRFVRAVYYSQFAEKVDDPDDAVRTLAHVMNNFDRPRGITMDAANGGEGSALAVLESDGSAFSTEYTSWTNLTDLERNRMYLRTYKGLNYSVLDMAALAEADGVRVMPLAALDGMPTDGATEALLAAAAP